MLQQGSINVRLDVTNQHIAATLQLKLVEAFQKFMAQMVTVCGQPEVCLTVQPEVCLILQSMSDFST